MNIRVISRLCPGQRVQFIVRPESESDDALLNVALQGNPSIRMDSTGYASDLPLHRSFTFSVGEDKVAQTPDVVVRKGSMSLKERIAYAIRRRLAEEPSAVGYTEQRFADGLRVALEIIEKTHGGDE